MMNKLIKLEFMNNGFSRIFWGVTLIPVIIGAWIAYMIWEDYP